MDDVRHAGFQAYAGKDALRRGISHLDRGNDKIGLVLVFGYIHPGPWVMDGGGGLSTIWGFRFNEAGKKADTYTPNLVCRSL